MLAQHNVFQRAVSSEQETEALAVRLAHVLPPRLFIGLVGTLGAGKTRFVKGLASGMGIPADDVTSPTFVMCQTHRGDHVLHHLDAYRIADDDEWYELGIEELLEEDAITVIEWSDRFVHLLPIERLDIQIEVTDEVCRTFTLTAHGAQALEVLRALA